MGILIEEWKHGWKFLTTWMGIFITALPNLWDLAISSGQMPPMESLPENFQWVLRATGVLVLICRFINQNRKKSHG